MTVEDYHNTPFKAWCTANGTGTVAIIDSHNISSLADPESGQLVNNFANSMANSNYTVIVNVHDYVYTFGGMDMSTSSFKAVQSNPRLMLIQIEFTV